MFRSDNDVKTPHTNSSIRYRGPRRASDITSFVLRASLPTISTVDRKTIQPLLELDPYGESPVFIAYTDSGDTKTRALFTKIAEKHQTQYTFGISDDQELAVEELGHVQVKTPAIVAYKPSISERDVLPLNLPGAKTRTQIEAFISNSAEPLIGELTRRNEMTYLQSQKLLAYVFLTTDTDRVFFRRALYPAAKKYKDYVSFVTIDVEEYGHMASGLGLRKKKYPALTVYSAWKDQVFPFPEEVLEKGEAVPDDVELFVRSILTGKREPWKPAGPGGHDEL